LPAGAILYDELEEYKINGCVQNKMTLKCAKNHGNWLRHFEDIIIIWAFKRDGVFFDPPCRVPGHCLRDPMFWYSDTIPACDGWTDRWTDTRRRL